ncbi:MAG: DUF166 family protein [Promethearchaeota archaeon]
MEILKVGVISDGKYGERAYVNISKKFNTKWILIPEIPSNIMLDEDLDFEIPECDLYISYVRHPDIILQLAELQKPLVLGVLPGIGLYKQAKNINFRVVTAPTMCSLENNTGIPEVDRFAIYFGKPIYDLFINEEGIFEDIKVTRSSLCGSSEAGSKFLLNKPVNEDILTNFALSVCHECRAPRFGHTCDKEVAGIIHLNSIFNCLPDDRINNFDEKLKLFIDNMKNEYERRTKNSRILLNEVN